MKSIICLVSYLTLVGCGNFFRDKTESNFEEVSNSETTIDFAKVRSEIFEPHCIKCHSNYANFASVKQIISSILTSVEQNRMPKNAPPLNENLKALLRVWVAEGTNEFLGDNSLNQPPQDDPTLLKPTWNSLSLNIFEPKCLVCHSPNGQAPWVDFSNRTAMAKTLLKHINFKNPEDSNLIIRLRDPEEPMPPLPPDSTISQLTEDEVLVVIDWINLGVP